MLLRKISASVSTQQNRSLIQPAHPRQTPSPRGRMPAKVWVELVMGLMSAAFLALALLSPHWMELSFGLAPDAGNGSAEYGMALSWAAVSLLMFALAGRTWRNHVRISSVSLATER